MSVHKGSLYFGKTPTLVVDSSHYALNCDEFLKLYQRCEAKYHEQTACLKEKDDYLQCSKLHNERKRNEYVKC
jgi:hypothetical protein